MSGRSLSTRSIACLPSPTASTCTSSSANVSSMTRWIVTLSSASSSLCAMASDLLDAGARVLVDEGDDLLHRRPGQEDPFHPDLAQPRNVDVRDDAPDDDEHVVEALLFEQLHDARADVHVRPRQDRQADGVGVFLERGADDLLGGLAEAGVDDLHPRVAQRAGDDLGAPIVPVEARLGDDDSNLSHVVRSGRSGRYTVSAATSSR